MNNRNISIHNFNVFLGLIDHWGKLQDIKTNRQADKQGGWAEARTQTRTPAKEPAPGARPAGGSGQASAAGRSCASSPNSATPAGSSGPQQEQMQIPLGTTLLR